MRIKLSIFLVATSIAAATAADAAVDAPGDRVDPALAREQVKRSEPRPVGKVAPTAVPNAAPAAPELAQAIVVAAVKVEGATVVDASAFAPAIQPFLGRPLQGNDLRSLASEIAAVLRRSGYGLATAFVPQQKIENGILRVVVDEGRIDAVEAGGDTAVERVLRVLANGKPVRTEMLERQLLLAEDLAGATLARPAIVRRDGKNVLTVEVYRNQADGRIGVDNWGSASDGPVRATLNVDMHSVLADNDRLSLNAAITPLQPKEFQFVEAIYGKTLDSHGTDAQVSGSISHTQTRDAGDGRLYEGTSEEGHVQVTHAIARSRQFSGWIGGDLALLDSSLSRDGQPVRSDRIATASAIFNLLARGKSSWIRGHLAFVQGLDVLGATDPGDPLASRRDASGVFSKLEFGSAFAADIAPRLGIGLAIYGQLASRPLLVTQEIGLGGQSFLRAFDYREVSGDNGAAASAELRYELGGLPHPVHRAQLFAYADGGRVTNLENGFGGGSLASAGGGFRAWLDSGFEGSLQVGVPLTDSPFDKDPSPRVSFTLAKTFQSPTKH